jgi:tetratricopeptide (TPR) repeat protein/predicted Ser/Thr protein kinase
MTGSCPFCSRDGVEMVGAGELQFCRSCAELVDVSAALRHLPDKPEEPAARLGRYEIVREVGRGVSGTVFEARDPDLGRRVALKVLDAAQMGDKPLRRFLREGRLLAKIRHPNVVEVHELGRDGGKVFIAMEFVDGAPFPATPDRGEAIRRLVAIGHALDHVHRQGIIHRDLKPSNILVEKSGRPVLMDFGIARSEDTGASSVTAPGAVLGTPGYMAPEQISGDLGSIDARTDVFALGVLLFEVLTGRLPFNASSVQEYAQRMKSGETPSPRSVRKDIPAALEAFCRKSIASTKEARPASAEEFAQGLAKALTAPPPLLKRYAKPLLVAGGALVFGLGAIAWSARSRKDAESAVGASAPAAAGTEEAARRVARVLGGSLGFDAAMAEIGECERLYQRTLEADPRNVAALGGLGRLYADLGRATEAHRSFDRALAQNPGNLDLLRAKGALIVTAQLQILFDRKSFPKLSRALAERLGEEQGRAMDNLRKRLPETGTAVEWTRFYRAVAKSEFEEAKRVLARVPVVEEMPRLHYALHALIEQARPAGGAQARADEEYPSDRGDAAAWLALIRHLDHRSVKARTAGNSQGQRTRVNASQLRVESLIWESHGDRAKAAEALGHATAAAPDYLQALLLRAKLLKDLGRQDQAARQLEIADRLATSIGLGPAAMEELRSPP